MRCIACLGVIFAGLATAAPPANVFPVEFGRGETHDLERSIQADVLSLRTTGNDPYLWLELPKLPQAPSRDWILSMETFCPEGVDTIQLFVGYPADPKNVTTLPKIDVSEGWTTYRANLSEALSRWSLTDQSWLVRLDLGTQSQVRLQIRNPQIRQQNDAEWLEVQQAEQRREQKIGLAAKIDRYYERNWPVSIEQIQLDGQAVLISGAATGFESELPLRLVPRMPHETAALAPNDDEFPQSFPITIDRRGRFQERLSFASDSPWRGPGVRWQVLAGDQMMSAARHIDQFSPSSIRPLEPPAKLSAAKGITCVSERLSLQDLKTLGIRHASVNILLNGLIRTSAAPGYQAITIRGQDVFFNTNVVHHLDRRCRLGQDADLVMAGILLIANRTSPLEPLVHPEANPAGTYSMPNLTTRASANLYSLTLEFLADRYARADGKYGRIDHWIVHNEIDAGWHWTNMGEQPRSVYLDHYFRSLRMVDSAVRRVNPWARVFVPLTHHWDGELNRTWRWYRSRRIVESLVRHDQLEGEFPWGIAHHPYPESLWESDTWADNPMECRDRIDTPKITPKNLIVLDRLMHSESLRLQDGSLRPVLLSEQGFHAAEDDPQALQRQSAALLYTFEQIRMCPSILAFDYHRPTDHPNEGGLRLGLRGLPTKEYPAGPLKPAWDVYRQIGTPTESALRQQHAHFWAGEGSTAR